MQKKTCNYHTIPHWFNIDLFVFASDVTDTINYLCKKYLDFFIQNIHQKEIEKVNSDFYY